MRSIGRAVASILLAGAVAGVAAFAHLLASEPAPAPFGVAALPPAPVSPLVVQAADGTFPVRTHIVRQALHRAVVLPTLAASRPIVISRIPAPARAAAPTTTPTSKRTQVTPHPPAASAPNPPAGTGPNPPATPVPAAPSKPSVQPTAPQPASPAPVAAPALTPADRTLAQTAPAVVPVVPVVPGVAIVTPVANGREDRHYWHGRHGRGGGDQSDNNNGNNGNNGGDTGMTVLSAVPVDNTTPPPVETPPMPSVDPPPVDSPPVDVTPDHTDGHDHWNRCHGQGHGYGDRHGAEGDGSD